MTIPKKKFREIVFQALYSLDMGECAQEDLIPLLMKELAITKKISLQALFQAQEIYAKRSSFDKLIAQNSKEYAFHRIPSVERNILRLSLFELLDDPHIPPEVVIAESLRLAKKFSTAEAGSFIHAILDQIIRKIAETDDQEGKVADDAEP